MTLENYMSEYIEAFLDFLDANTENLSMETANLQEANDDLCDIEHYIEFGKADARAMLKLYKLNRQARQMRRHAKEQIELSIPISEWTKKNASALRELREVLGTVRKVERLQSFRAYAIKEHILDEFTHQSHLTNNYKTE